VAGGEVASKCPLASQKHDSNIIYSSNGCDGRMENKETNEHEATCYSPRSWVLSARFKRFTDFQLQLHSFILYIYIVLYL